MKRIFTVVAAIVAGFLGGIVGTRIGGARDQIVVRAHSFELLNDAGEVISFWGVDSAQSATLAFGSRRRGLGGARPQGVPAGITNPDNQLLAIGLASADEPMLKMRGTDGKIRASLYVAPYEKPFLLMEDETGPRVLLGIEQSDTPGPEDNNWSLLFLPQRARIGMGTVKEGGQNYVVGTFFLNRNKVKYPDPQPK